jgi:hypothetical protein
MSTYHPAAFALQRLASGTWVSIPAASITYSSDYTLADHRDGVPPSHIQSLVIGSETATITLSRWDTDGAVLYPGDRVRAAYAGHVWFQGTVESVSVTYATDEEAPDHGATRRVDISAAVGGYYADMLSRTVRWPGLIQQQWIDRIRRWVVVEDW